MLVDGEKERVLNCGTSPANVKVKYCFLMGFFLTMLGLVWWKLSLPMAVQLELNDL